MVTTRRMSTGATPAKRAVSPSTPSRRRSTSTSKAAAPATPSGSRTKRRGAASKASSAAKSTASGGKYIKNKELRLAFEAAGIYACFITWGIVQERITTTDYQPGPGLGGRPGRFSSMISLNGACDSERGCSGPFGCTS